jgi:hypothetical protein
MNQPASPTAVSPLVAQNPFRQRPFSPAPIPSFTEARARLPIPVLPEHPGWVEMYWRAWELAWLNLRRPKAESRLIASYLDAAVNGVALLWDSAFMVQFGWYGRRAFPFINMLDNFYARQHDDGFICRSFDTLSGADCYYPFDPNGDGPNILAWAEWRYFRVTGDDGRLPHIFPALLAYHRWRRAHRTWPGGLYWTTGQASAMENQPRVPDSRTYHRHWTWLDANLQAILNCRIMEQIGILLEEKGAAQEFADERARLVRKVNEQMWQDETSFYHDVDPNGRFSPVKSIAAYWALLDKEAVPEDRLGPLVQQLRETWAFKVAHRVPSLSADSEAYNPGTGNGWRGGVWPAANYMVLRGLRLIGQDSLAHAIAVNHLQNVWETYQHSDTFWENYAPEQACPGEAARPDFVGCTGLSPIAMLFEDVIGLSVDWPLRRVIWDRRLETDATYGVQNYPLGQDGLLTLLGDKEKVTVDTDVSFTLTIRDGSFNLQTAVPTGHTTLDLT